MAALSCYQPCRSHLAQPARCLDEDDHNSASLSLRRRQFIERCQESRGGRHRDYIPEVSVKRTREELAKHAAAAPLTRRLNVDSSWSKVEEVRKKFEGATDTSYSRSFESPPRRRLADSLFASFKLPRKKEGMAAPRSLVPQPQQKRKSAVELLAETKAFYVKSETVLDRKQELPLRVSSGLSQAIAAGGCHLVSSGTANTDACCNPSHKIYPDSRRKESYPEREGRSQHTSGTFSGTSSSGTSGSKPHRLEPDRERLSFGDARVFFPESFVIPRQRPSEVIIKNTYSIPSPQSSGGQLVQLGQMELPEPVASGQGSPADPGAISPPAQYAHSAPRYIRSNSHSQPSMREEEGCTNINSHKSLPDLHAQAHTYPEPTTVGGTDTLGRSPRRRRHSAHHRTASCSSKGTSRCGSSFARDSGGSSGHYTQRSAPPHARPPRADSGSSTQHEHASRYGARAREPAECYVSAPPQFQDGAPSPPPRPRSTPPRPTPPHTTPHIPASVYTSRNASRTASIDTINCPPQASAPPPQFQDEPPVYDYGDYECTYKAPLKCLNVGRHEYTARDYNRYHEPSTELVSKQPQYQDPRRVRHEDTQDYVNAPQQKCGGEEVTSPLGTFKRQRCLRYKQRRPRPILRSKSDISDRYRRTDGRSASSAPCEGEREVQGPGVQKQIYRNTEPPSVVERNARIIKWLCQCRKTQMQPPQ
ncbi:hypothetical protein RR46_07659 [Papilio xuthus]|uniref:Centrosome-associated FAM110 C-terminal domain-containing protein n=1 Tax=Papilio xuthus TaxID=66420 RepID=A0A194Q743_PAPXU|nr:hypothetical protein RR46_07659 [Papilio xuthus]